MKKINYRNQTKNMLIRAKRKFRYIRFRTKLKKTLTNS